MEEKVKKPRAKKAKKIEDISNTVEVPLDVSKRERKVNIQLLPSDQWEELSKQLGQKCSDILEKAKFDCDQLLNIYGLKLRNHTLIVPADYPEEIIE